MIGGRTIDRAIERAARWRVCGGVLAGAALVAALIPALPASAAVTGTIVFTKDHNVWVMAADDPSTAKAVTTDGTADRPYRSPTQDDDGRILVIVGREDDAHDVVRMDQEGALLGEPFRPPAGNLIDLDVRADGEIFAYTHYDSYQTPQGFLVVPSVSFAYADGRDSSDLGGAVFDEAYANYYGDAAETVMTSFDDDSNATIATLAPAEAEPQDWFRPCDTAEGNTEFEFCSPSFAHITSAQDRLAVAVPGQSDFSDPQARLWVFDMPGPVPAAPTWGCELRSPARPDEFVAAEAEFYSPEWSPDGSALVYEFYEAPNNSGLPVGIYIASGFDTGCEDAFASAELVVADGANPDWSAAPLGASPGPDPGPSPGPSPRPSPGPSPTPGPSPSPGPSETPPPDEPTAGFDGNARTTERLNFSNPVAIALGISRGRFAEDGAARVVLSRDDRFPDSLAGASLTSDGPLLFTPTGTLHQQTREEIARVLPPGGTVHLLGGTGAISQEVADQIEADGFTVDRLAGASRMETAIAVADRVRQQAPDVDRVALARAFGPGGDDTAAWADSVTGGGYGAAAGVPILITDSAALHPAVEAWLAADAPSQTLLFGGEAALSAEVADAVPAPQRVAGAERTETAARIATQLWGTPTTGERRFIIINGFLEDGWAYGLAAGGLAAQTGAPLLMVGDDVPASTATLVTGCTEVDLVLTGSGNEISHPVSVRLDELDQEGC